MKKIKPIFMKAVDKLGYVLPLMIVFMMLGRILGIQPFIVMSGSMEPIITTGSICLVNTKTDYEEICVGDVIAYENNAGMFVTHRVISKTEDGCTTKGDANDVADRAVVKSNDFVGKTIFAIPYVGYVINFLKNNIVLFLVSIFTYIFLRKK